MTVYDIYLESFVTLEMDVINSSDVGKQSSLQRGIEKCFSIPML
jgi:hypothetical protein